MKRDMELVRSIVLAIEDSPFGSAPALELPGHTKEQIGYHVLIMMEGGLLQGAEVTPHAADTPQGLASRLTWAGHEFADAARDNSRWKKAREIVAAKAETVTITVLTRLLTSLMSEALKL